MEMCPWITAVKNVCFGFTNVSRNRSFGSCVSRYKFTVTFTIIFILLLWYFPCHVLVLECLDLFVVLVSLNWNYLKENIHVLPKTVFLNVSLWWESICPIFTWRAPTCGKIKSWIKSRLKVLIVLDAAVCCCVRLSKCNATRLWKSCKRWCSGNIYQVFMHPNLNCS